MTSGVVQLTSTALQPRFSARFRRASCVHVVRASSVQSSDPDQRCNGSNGKRQTGTSRRQALASSAYSNLHKAKLLDHTKHHVVTIPFAKSPVQTPSQQPGSLT